MDIIPGTEKVINRLHNKISNKILASHNICIFGYNQLTKILIQDITDSGFQITKIIDNGKAGFTAFNGIIIQKPSEALLPYDADTIIIIASKYHKEMKKQVKNLDKRYGKSCYIIDDVKGKNELFYKRFPNLYNQLMETIGYQYFSVRYPVEKKLVEKNIRFKNIHKGERCFILGNGPSMDSVDFSLLKNEVLFGVNQIMDFRGYESLPLKYWVCIDSAFQEFGTSISGEPFNETILKLKEKVSECFLYIEYKPWIEKHKLERQLSINYLCHELHYDLCDRELCPTKDLRLERFAIRANTVVLMAIEIALYMGFSEIYLLGCDSTILYNMMQNMLNDASDQVHFSMSHEDRTKEITKEFMKKSNSFTIKLKSMLIQHQQYAMINEYCKARQVKLINLTEETLITELERGHLKDICM